MEMAATRALAELAKQEVPESVSRAYGGDKLSSGPTTLIPKPFDPRVLLWSPRVALGRRRLGYRGTDHRRRGVPRELEARLGPERQVMRADPRAQQDPPSIVFPEGDDPPHPARLTILADEGIARPILLGDLDAIRRQADGARSRSRSSSSSSASSSPRPVRQIVATPPAARHDATRSAGPSARSVYYGL